MKKSLFYFLLPVICISTGFYFLNYGQDKKIAPPATLPAPLEKLVPLPQLIQPAPVPPSNNTQSTAVIPAPKVFEEIQKEKNKNQNVDLVDGIFTIEEIKQLRKMLNELNKK